MNVKNMLQEGTRSLMFKQQLTVCLMLDVYFDVHCKCSLLILYHIAQFIDGENID